MLVATDALETGIAYFQLAQSLHILFIFRDPFRPLRHARTLTFVGWCLTASEPLTVLVFLMRTHGAHDILPTCLPERLTKLLDGVRFFLASVDAVVVLSATTIAILLVIRLRSGLEISRKSRHRVSEQLKFYTIGFNIYNSAHALLTGGPRARRGCRRCRSALGSVHVPLHAPGIHNAPATHPPCTHHGHSMHPCQPHTVPCTRPRPSPSVGSPTLTHGTARL